MENLSSGRPPGTAKTRDKVIHYRNRFFLSPEIKKISAGLGPLPVQKNPRFQKAGLLKFI
jgi:hypothetical protein